MTVPLIRETSRAATLPAIPPARRCQLPFQRRRVALRTRTRNLNVANRQGNTSKRCFSVACAIALLCSPAVVFAADTRAAWTTGQAERYVTAKPRFASVRMRCSSSVRFRVSPKQPYRYTRFECFWPRSDGVGDNRIEVFVTGKTTFRWKTI